eukprot:12271398-Ditylum_brightwellii.AAC.1
MVKAAKMVVSIDDAAAELDKWLRKVTLQKTKFHSYFNTLQRRDEYLDCNAHHSGKPWKVLVSAVVECLPEVTPDVP